MGFADSIPSRVQPSASRVGLSSYVRQSAVLVIGSGILLGGLVLSISIGAVFINPSDVLNAVVGDADRVPRQIIWNLRVPRALVGALVGVNLAVSGVLLQGVMRNPLAAPTIVGVTAGAGLAATAVMVLMPGLPTFIPLVAFGGAMAASVFVYLLSWQPGLGTSPMRMVLAGVAVTSMLGAFTTGLMVILWLAGNLVGRSWNHLELVWLYSVFGLIGALLLVRQLNVMQLGDDAARGLGVRTERMRLTAIALASLLAASAVSVAGLVGFVGLMVPHVMRLLGGHNHAYLVIASAIGGAALMVWADLGARMVLSPLEMPVGIITALIGGPFFVFLLYRTRFIGGRGV
ncbi:MAG: iron ABC transporter permease [Dehalococcoidia bacterium]|nr:iron ABC transporter permease [Dehalococcoidia bacterium]